MLLRRSKNSCPLFGSYSTTFLHPLLLSRSTFICTKREKYGGNNLIVCVWKMYKSFKRTIPKLRTKRIKWGREKQIWRQVDTDWSSSLKFVFKCRNWSKCSNQHISVILRFERRINYKIGVDHWTVFNVFRTYQSMYFQTDKISYTQSMSFFKNTLGIASERIKSSKS